MVQIVTSVNMGLPRQPLHGLSETAARTRWTTNAGDCKRPAPVRGRDASNAPAFGVLHPKHRFHSAPPAQRRGCLTGAAARPRMATVGFALDHLLSRHFKLADKSLVSRLRPRSAALCIMRWCDDCMASRRRLLIAHPKHGARHISPSSGSRIRLGRYLRCPPSLLRGGKLRNGKRAAKEGTNLGDDDAPREDIDVARFLPLLCTNHDGDDVCSAARRPPQASELAAWHCAKCRGSEKNKNFCFVPRTIDPLVITMSSYFADVPEVRQRPWTGQGWPRPCEVRGTRRCGAAVGALVLPQRPSLLCRRCRPILSSPSLGASRQTRGTCNTCHPGILGRGSGMRARLARSRQHQPPRQGAEVRPRRRRAAQV